MRNDDCNGRWRGLVVIVVELRLSRWIMRLGFGEVGRAFEPGGLALKWWPEAVRANLVASHLGRE